MEDATRHGSSSLRDYLRILQERKWVVILPLVLIPLAAVFFSVRQQRMYQASADVLLKRQDLAATISGILESYEDPSRFVQTQIELAKVPEIAQRVLSSTRVRTRTPTSLLKSTSVVSSASSDLLTFRVTDRNPGVAVRLATAYGEQFVNYRRELDTGAVNRTLSQVERRLAQLRNPGRASPLFTTYASLVDKREQLRTLQALQTSNAAVVRPASSALQVRPRPKRNAAIGLLLGLVFGVGLAFLWHALDTRVRSVEQIRDALGLPLLARIPGPSRRMRRGNQVAMLADPTSAQAEAFRMLRTNLEFVNLERRARTIMFTSAVEREGKSTTVVNLAVALARARHRVVVVDLDLRRPSLDSTFGLKGRPGVTDVALGHASLDEAISAIAIPDAGSRNGRVENGNAGRGVSGLLEVVTSGPVPPDPGEFVATNLVSEILRQLRDRAEVVLIDAPPLLHVGDAMALSAKVDGLVVVTRLNVVRRPMLGELRRLLDASPAAKLGFVLTGADFEEGYGYANYYAPRPTRDVERQRVS